MEIGVITSDFPVPGALPPEVYPRELWGLDTGPDLTWLLVVMTAVGVVGLLAAAVVLVPQLLRWRPRWPRLRWRYTRRERSAEPPQTEPAVVEPLPADAEIARRALDAALVSLHNPADSRAAVIAAYARMEDVLASRELGRRMPEAPREYLTRVLREQGMPERSLTTLTDLFEEARFSPHPIPTPRPLGRAASWRPRGRPCPRPTHHDRGCSHRRRAWTTSSDRASRPPREDDLTGRLQRNF